MKVHLKKRTLVFVAVAFTLILTSEAFAGNTIVKAKTDKDVYKLGEPIYVVLEVENNEAKQIISNPPPTRPWAGDLSKGNLTFVLYRNDYGMYDTISAKLVGKGYLLPLKLAGSGNTSAPVVIPPYSTAAVGRGDVFGRIIIAPGPPDTRPGVFIMMLRFSGQVSSTSSVVGYAIVTFTVE